MKKFLIRLVIFTVFFFLVDKLFIFVRNAGPQLEVDRRLEMILEGQINAEVLVFGSSRGARSVIAQRFIDSLGVSAYSLAYPGSDVTFHEYLLRQTLEVKGNKKPKTVILVVDDSDELKPAKSLKFRFDRMYPLVKYKSVRDEMVKRKEKKPIITELLVLHQMNKSNFLFKQRKFTKNDSIMPCGSMPISHQKKTFDKKYNTEIYNYTREDELIQKIKAFRAFKDHCKDNNIQLIVAIPPNFRKVTIGFVPRLKQVMDGHGTIFMYNETRPEYSNPDFFFDNTHLQKAGSEIYTMELVHYYKELNDL
ncbi:MAG: hypothetical protein ACK46O_09860 [Flavobacteriia bacterium]|jgi:hypothetical protein